MSTQEPSMGMGRGKVFPATSAGSLLHPFRRFLQSPSRTVRSMDLSPGWSVLEVGCGPGFFTPALAATAPAVLVALDLQTTMLHWLRGRAETSSVNADAMALPFAARSFNAAVVATMLGEVPSPEHCLAEIHRVLKPGGVLCIAETRRDSDFIRLAALCALAEPRGFRLVGHRGPRWQYVARFAKQ